MSALRHLTGLKGHFVLAEARTLQFFRLRYPAWEQQTEKSPGSYAGACRDLFKRGIHVERDLTILPLVY